MDTPTEFCCDIRPRDFITAKHVTGHVGIEMSTVGSDVGLVFLWPEDALEFAAAIINAASLAQKYQRNNPKDANDE